MQQICHTEILANWTIHLHPGEFANWTARQLYSKQDKPVRMSINSNTTLISYTGQLQRDL